ncbi:Protein fem-1-like protein [Seiridium cupressi]
MNLTTPLSKESSALQLVLDGAAMERVHGSIVEVSRLCETFIEKVFTSTSLSKQESNIMLRYALRHGNKSLLVLLVSRGADLTFCQRTKLSHVSRVTAITCAAEFTDTSRGEPWSRWLECVVCLMTPHSRDFFRARPPQFFVDPLIAAAAAGNDDAIEHLLALGGNLDLENEDGIYPLLAAIAKGRYHTCKLLINSGSDVNHLGPSGLCPLHVAIMAGEPDVLKLLVESAADIKRILDNKRGPGLCWGILHRFHLRMEDFNQHMHLNPPDIAPLITPYLTDAKMHGIGDCIQYLLNNGVFWSPGIFPPIQSILDNNLWNILLKIDGTLSGREQRHYDRIMKHFIKRAIRDKNRNFLATFHRKKSGPNGDEICAALAKADIDKAVALLKASGNLYERSSWDESFLDVALQSQDGCTIRWALAADFQYYDPGALLAAVELELKSGIAPRQANVPYYRVILNRRPENQEAHIWETTAVGKAANWNNIELLRDLLAAIPPSKYCLLERKTCFLRHSIAEVHPTRTPLGSYHRIYASPLAWAVGLDKDDIYKIMVKRGYQPDSLTFYIAMAKGKLGSSKRNGKLGPVITTSTPIQSAATWNRTDIVRWLIDDGADVNDWNIPRAEEWRRTQSPLQAAVCHGNVEMLELLLQAGARPNDKLHGFGGRTALQEAAEKGEIGIAKLLLDHEPPADVNAHRAPCGGVTALEAAACNGRLDMVQLLLCRGVKTEGTGHRQYIRAVRLAQHRGHIEVVSLLKAHRPWTIMDQDWFANEEIHWAVTRLHESECSDSECDFPHDWSESDTDSDTDSDTGEDNRQGDEGADERGGGERTDDENMSCAEYMIDECTWENWNLEHTSYIGGMAQEEFESEVALWDPVNACFK